jgi:hypothetical protein
MGVTEWAERRRAARIGEDPPERATITAQTAIAAPAGRVWALAWDPATSLLTDEGVSYSFTVPGTPAGQVGEIQCHVRTFAEGAQVGILTEVVELDPGRRAVTRSLTQPGPDRNTTEVIPVDERSCLLRVTYLTHGLDAQAQAAVRTYAENYVTRLRDIAEVAQRSSEQD